MKSVRHIAIALLAAAVAAGCASTNVSQRETLVAGKILRPDRILVYDFGVTPADVPADSALAGRYDPQQQQSPDEIAEGRKLGSALARDLAEEIRDMGLPAESTSPGVVPQLHDVVIRGYFASIDEGSAAKRMVIGFGAGSAKLTTVVEGYQMTEYGLRKLGSGTVESGGAKGPGAVVPAAVAVATANPIGLIVSSAVKVEGEVSGRSTIEGRAEATAKEIAEQLRPRFEQQGWID
jgi:hypothetical protein